MPSPTDHRPAADRGARPGTNHDIRPAGSRSRGRPVWRVGDIDFTRADARHRSDTTLFYLLTGASFVESGSELYTRNLLTYYRDVPQIADWLTNVWEPEELQHGAALRAYVQAVWPEFDWHKAYQGFIAEYSQAASPEAFEATPHLELAARCMIETGTATLYRMLHDYAQEPVLRRVLASIRELHSIMRRRFPLRMAADMLIAPLALPLLIRRLVRRVAEAGLRRVLFA